jgi:hypothetical protein
VTAALAAAAVVSLSPARIHFGDTVTAIVQGAGAPDVAPFAIVGRHGDVYELRCLDPACVPGPRGRVLAVGAEHVTVLPSATPRQVAAPARSFRAQTALPPPSYRIRPSLLRGILFTLSALLAVGAVVVLRPRRRRVVAHDGRSPLERALAFARESLGRSPEDRRRALDLLGRALGPDEAARSAFELAWSPPQPDPERVEQLVDAVDRSS